MPRLTGLKNFGVALTLSIVSAIALTGCSTSSNTPGRCSDITQADDATYTDSSWDANDLRYVTLGTFRCTSEAFIDLVVKLPEPKLLKMGDNLVALGENQQEYTMASSIDDLLKQSDADEIFYLSKVRQPVARNSKFQIYASFGATSQLAGNGPQRIEVEIHFDNNHGERIASFQKFVTIGSSDMQ